MKPPLSCRAIYVVALAVSSLAASNVTHAAIYETENAELHPAFVVENQNPGYSGEGYVNVVREGYVLWTVDVPSAGNYDLAFRYALREGDRPMTVSVNGKDVASNVSFPSTQRWVSWDQVRLGARLEAGSNQVRLTTTGASGPNLDYLRVSRSRGVTQYGNTAIVAAGGGDYDSLEDALRNVSDDAGTAMTRRCWDSELANDRRAA
jgi:hypothetical protein